MSLSSPSVIFEGIIFSTISKFKWNLGYRIGGFRWFSFSSRSRPSSVITLLGRADIVKGHRGHGKGTDTNPVHWHQFRHFSRSSCANCKGSGQGQEEPLLPILFLGNESFSVPSLSTLRTSFGDDRLVVGVSSTEKKRNPVSKSAKASDLQVISWNEVKDLTSVQKSIKEEKPRPKFHLGVVASFGYLIPNSVIQCCKFGILNVHASLLPRWRGATPISHALMHGDEVTGVSIMKIAPFKFDVGPILHQKSLRIHPHIREPELRDLLGQLGAEALKEVLSDLDTFLQKSRPQPEVGVTLAPKLSPEIFQIRWDSLTAQEVYNLYRGLFQLGTIWTNYQGRKIDLTDLAVGPHPGQTDDAQCSEDSSLKSENKFITSDTDFGQYYSPPVVINRDVVSAVKPATSSVPGQIVFSYKFNVLCIKCKSTVGQSQDETSSDPLNSWIFVRKVKIGTKWMSASDFQNGYLSKPGASHNFEYCPIVELNSQRVSKGE